MYAGMLFALAEAAGGALASASFDTDVLVFQAEEISIIEGFLPAQMNDDEIAAAVDSVISDVEATTLKDMGKVMATLKEQFAGQMDFGKASSAVKTKLG